MSKYNFELDMESQNSNSIILKGIRPETTILEVGCAHGRMTKYLKEQLNCVVDIAEIDPEAGEIASQWANRAWLGTDGNVQSPHYFFQLKNYGDMRVEGDYTIHNKCEYDYVIYADVLEHLIDPASVLTDTKQVLKPEGSIWISVPNVAYNGIIIDLINDQFTYREIGLMDNTHLRWFTMKSLNKMVKKCGYQIVNEYNVINSIRNSEFKDAYTKVPPQIASFLKFRPGGEVYQMIWELKANG